MLWKHTGDKKRAAILLGPAGSGKTTLARALSGDGVCVIETGNLLEAEVRAETELGRQIEPYKVAGELVPSELVKKVISAELNRTQSWVVLFDGFPRSLDQVELLMELLDEHNLEISVVIELKLDLTKSIRRLSGRRICSQCGALFNIYSNPPRHEGICDRCGGKLIQRGDDQEELVRRRFATFERETIPVIEYFRRECPDLICTEDAETPLPEIEKHILARLNNAAR